MDMFNVCLLIPENQLSNHSLAPITRHGKPIKLWISPGPRYIIDIRTAETLYMFHCRLKSHLHTAYAEICSHTWVPMQRHVRTNTHAEHISLSIEVLDESVS